MLANDKKLKNVLGAAGLCAAAACVIASADQTTVFAAENYAETAEAGESAEVTLESLIEDNGASVLLSDDFDDDNDTALVLEAGAGAHFEAVSKEIKAAEESRERAEAEVEAAEEAREAEAAAQEAETAEESEETAEASEEALEATEETAEAEEVLEENEETAVQESETVEETAAAVETTAVEAEPAVETVETAAATPAIANNDFLALCKIVQAEAGSEPVQGKIAVANVVLNRINHPSFPSTVEDVIRQPGQFTPVRTGSYALAVPSSETIDAVNAALNGIDCSGGALYFKRSSSSSWGSRSLINRIGNHGFYA